MKASSQVSTLVATSLPAWQFDGRSRATAAEQTAHASVALTDCSLRSDDPQVERSTLVDMSDMDH
eukprot:394128-Prymnesium_polylepis.1